MIRYRGLLLLLVALAGLRVAASPTTSSSASVSASISPSTSASTSTSLSPSLSPSPSLTLSQPPTPSGPASSRSPSPDATASLTASASRSAPSSRPSPSACPSPTPSLAASATARGASGSGSHSPSVSPSASRSAPSSRPSTSASALLSPSPSALPTDHPSASATPSQCPSASASGAASRSHAGATPSPSPSPCASATPPHGSASAAASPSGSASASLSPSPSASPSASSCGSASAPPSATHCASASPSLSACPSASSSPTATGSRGPSPSAQGSASRCPSASATASPSASGSPSASASASAAATPSATSSAPPCSCKANALASSAGGACPTPLLNVSWPMGWRDDAQLLPNASAAAPPPASALVASWPAIRSAVTITLPFPPSAQEQVTLTCALAGAGAALLGLAVQAQPAAPSTCTPVTGGACSIALNASSPLTSTLYLYARGAAAAGNGAAPPAAAVLCTATSALRGGASDRPCASAAAAPVYPRLTQLTPAPLPVRHLPSVWALVGAVLAEEYSAQGSFTLAAKGGARLSLGAPPASCAAAAAAGGGARPTWSTVSIAASANASACARDLSAALRLAGARALPGANFSFTTGVASHLLLVAPPLADFPAGGVGAALGAIGRSGLLCRGPGDEPCDGNSTACCRVNWATQEVVSLSTPPYGEGAQSLCGGAAWCQVPLSLFALPHGADANASSGSPFFNSSAVGASGEGSPLAQQLWDAASSAAPPSALYPPTVFPPTPLTLARSASAWPLACAAQPPPPSPAALFACLNASGLALDLAPPPPPSLPDATGTEACTGLCLSSQCSVDIFDSLQSCKDVTPPSAAAPLFQQLAARCAYGFGTTCQPCVNASAAVCPGRNGLLVQPGHWAPPPDASGAFDLASVRECPPPALLRCPGSDAGAPGRAPRCSPGYSGTACAVCQRGWFTVQDGSCASCPRLETYLELVENLALSLGVLLGLAAALFLAAACALRSCGRAQHRSTSLRTLLLFLVLRVLALLLWVVIFSQQASLLFASVQSLAVYALRGVFELLAVLQFKGLSAPNSQCFGIPFPFTWACTLVVGLCYATVAGALGARWCCGSSSDGGSGRPKGSARGRHAVLSSSLAATGSPPSASTPPLPPSRPARASSALRDACAALPRGAVLLLTLGYGTLTNVFASVVTCSAAAPMPYTRYLDLGGDGSSLPPTAFAQFGGKPNFTLPSNFTVSVSLLADNPFQLCWEGYHTPAAAAGLACLVLFSLAFPLGALRVLQTRGQGCYASFCVAAPASRASQRTGCCHECYFCRRHSKWGSSRRFAEAPPPALPAPPVPAAPAAPAADPAAPLVAQLRALLHMPTLREGFLPLHQLTMSSVTLLLALPKAMPAAALGADIALVLLTSAAAATIKFHLKPFQVGGEKWQNTTLFAFYSSTAVTALMLAVTRNTPRLSAAGSWVLSLLAILSGAAAVCLVLYKWAVALYRCHPEEEVATVMGGKVVDAAAAAAAAEAEARAAAAAAARAAAAGAAAAAVAASKYTSNPMHNNRGVAGGGGGGGGGGGTAAAAAAAAAAQPPPPSHSTAAWFAGVFGSGEAVPAQPQPQPLPTQQQQNPALGGVGWGWEWGGGAPPLPPRPVYREPLLHLPGAPGEGAVSAYVQYTVRAIAGETARAAILRRQRERRAAAAAAGAAAAAQW